MKTNPHSTALRANFLCFAAMITWAAGFPAAEILLNSWGPISLMFVRMSIVVIFLLVVWCSLEGLGTILRVAWSKPIFIGAMGFGLGATFLIVGQQMSDAVTPAIAAAMMPIAGALLEMLFDGRRLHRKLVLGIILAIVGGFIATGANLSQSNFGLGAVICTASVFLFAWATRSATRELTGLSPIAQTTTTLVGAWLIVPLIGIAAVLLGYDAAIVLGAYDAKHIVLLLIFSIVAMSISQFLWIAGTGHLGILLASMHMNAIPFYVMISVVIFLGEAWNNTQAIGALIVGIGVILAQTKSDQSPRLNRYRQPSKSR